MGTFFAVWFYLFGGVHKLAEHLNEDGFLDLQLYPSSPLTILFTKSNDASLFEDFIQGVLFLGIYVFVNPSAVFFILPSLLLIVAGMTGIAVFINSILFYFPKILQVPYSIIDIYLGASSYPSQNFKGITKYILWTLLVFPIVYLPTEVTLGNFSPDHLLITTAFVLSINYLGLKLWKNGVKRVESGSSSGIVD